MKNPSAILLKGQELYAALTEAGLLRVRITPGEGTFYRVEQEAEKQAKTPEELGTANDVVRDGEQITKEDYFA
jgi:hypothetical protein